MTNKFAAAMRRAARAARAFNVLGATRMIPKAWSRSILSSLTTLPRVKPQAVRPESAGKASARLSARSAKPVGAGKRRASAALNVPEKAESRSRVPKDFRRPLGEALNILRTAANLRAASDLPGMTGGITGKVPSLPLPDGAQFLSRSFVCTAGARDFKLYVPASAPVQPKGLIIMLHGCTQNPDDFAAGTNMNAVAETQGLLIAYPAQTRTSNASSCWNWFEPGHQRRDAGEPAIIAGLARSLVNEFAIDKGQVFVAGLSAGAAMAVIMGKTYPDLFSAIGVHSGLAYQSAGNVMSALAVMRGNARSTMFGRAHEPDTNSEPVRAIIFHGSADRTVHPKNAQHILSAALGETKEGNQTTVSGSRKGRRFTQTVVASPNGDPLIESWLIDGAGHTWSGGHESGSYTDTQGPDASQEIVRFFLNAP